MKRWRCSNCNTEFRSEKHGCAACGIDCTAEPRFAGVVSEIQTVHYDPPHPRVRGHGLGTLACDPSRKVQGSRATGEPSAVNCEECRATAVWKANDRGPASLAADDELLRADGSILTSPCE